ncbi:sodium:calcium antiporter [Haladaptatus sp. DFWS20]|uniref:sodium:calcium antiporter n=1 Tax=Haladaptatus sp. DFWS20 TaxID=3403467 RepID=UPI003EB99CED
MRTKRPKISPRFANGLRFWAVSCSSRWRSKDSSRTPSVSANCSTRRTSFGGLTVIAAGTSLSDTLVSVRAARENNGVTSLANVFGSNVFDLLVAVPAGVLIAGSADIDFTVTVPMMGFLTLATVVVFGFLRTDLVLTNSESWGLLGFYGLFVVWLLLETVGVTNLVPGT